VIGGGGTGAEKLLASMPRAAWSSRKHGMSSSSSFWSRPVVGILDRASGRWWFAPFFYFTSKSNSAKRRRQRSRRPVAVVNRYIQLRHSWSVRTVNLKPST